MNCPYCNGTMQLRDSDVIYGRSYGMVWFCENWPGCDAFVGCHKGTDKPLGTPANGVLRNWRKRCHGLFDELWKSRRMTRRGAYDWMAEQLGIPVDQAHIALLSLEQCQQLHNALIEEGCP